MNRIRVRAVNNNNNINNKKSCDTISDRIHGIYATDGDAPINGIPPVRVMYVHYVMSTVDEKAGTDVSPQKHTVFFFVLL